MKFVIWDPGQTKSSELQSECNEAAWLQKGRSLKEKEARLHQLISKLSSMYPQHTEFLKYLHRSDGDESVPTIYVITPTYWRPVQEAELTRLSHTFQLVPKLHWIVIEDSNTTTKLVGDLLRRSLLTYTRLHVATPQAYKLPANPKLSWVHPRGVLQRNLGLQWLRTNLDAEKQKGVVYFADDDNTYDQALFEEMRSTKTVSVWPVGLVGGLLVEGPLVEGGKVVSWNSVWKRHRPFPIDMAGFAINLRLLLNHPNVAFKLKAEIGYQESLLLKEIVTISELEPRADNCSKVLVWHTRTEAPKLDQENNGSYIFQPNLPCFKKWSVREGVEVGIVQINSVTVSFVFLPVL
ncbi:PREDICTED: galactosylgalactosylxylosylprotein 3-beta-glucuronosyltransferase 1-like [Priapulus caudatus]|uniref:Galactosylgalactosylxylosylprotein 3-beta-glucuronosyltransferase n=1 Tax=Priapulus caudatus TaxID=37621 RepID=A0ABM1EI34_PRICU|nr:PREDICTED: galactosylgalactosylxylosylprotein 3-beta-glucuronosyltransferase 1-like [Priapulus caudatus]